MLQHVENWGMDKNLTLLGKTAHHLHGLAARESERCCSSLLIN